MESRLLDVTIFRFLTNYEFESMFHNQRLLSFDYS